MRRHSEQASAEIKLNNVRPREEVARRQVELFERRRELEAELYDIEIILLNIDTRLRFGHDAPNPEQWGL